MKAQGKLFTSSSLGRRGLLGQKKSLILFKIVWMMFFHRQMCSLGVESGMGS